MQTACVVSSATMYVLCILLCFFRLVLCCVFEHGYNGSITLNPFESLTIKDAASCQKICCNLQDRGCNAITYTEPPKSQCSLFSCTDYKTCSEVDTRRDDAESWFLFEPPTSTTTTTTTTTAITTEIPIPAECLDNVQVNGSRIKVSGFQELILEDLDACLRSCCSSQICNALNYLSPSRKCVLFNCEHRGKCRTTPDTHSSLIWLHDLTETLAPTSSTQQLTTTTPTTCPLEFANLNVKIGTQPFKKAFVSDPESCVKYCCNVLGEECRAASFYIKPRVQCLLFKCENKNDCDTSEQEGVVSFFFPSPTTADIGTKATTEAVTDLATLPEAPGFGFDDYDDDTTSTLTLPTTTANSDKTDSKITSNFFASSPDVTEQSQAHTEAETQVSDNPFSNMPELVNTTQTAAQNTIESSVTDGRFASTVDAASAVYNTDTTNDEENRTTESSIRDISFESTQPSDLLGTTEEEEESTGAAFYTMDTDVSNATDEIFTTGTTYDLSEATPEFSDTTDDFSEATPEFSDTTDDFSEATPAFSDTTDDFSFSEATPEFSDTTDDFSQMTTEFSDTTDDFNETMSEFTTDDFFETTPEFSDTTGDFSETTSEFSDTTEFFNETTSEFSDTTDDFNETMSEFSDTTDDFFETTPEFSDSTDDSSETTPEFPETTGDFSETTPEFSDATDDFSEISSEFSDSTDGLSETTPEFPETTGYFSEPTPEFSGSTDDFSEITSEFSETTDEFFETASEFPNTTNDYSEETSDFTETTAGYYELTTDELEFTNNATKESENTSMTPFDPEETTSIQAETIETLLSHNVTEEPPTTEPLFNTSSASHVATSSLTTNETGGESQTTNSNGYPFAASTFARDASVTNAPSPELTTGSVHITSPEQITQNISTENTPNPLPFPLTSPKEPDTTLEFVPTTESSYQPGGPLPDFIETADGQLIPGDSEAIVWTEVQGIPSTLAVLLFLAGLTVIGMTGMCALALLRKRSLRQREKDLLRHSQMPRERVPRHWVWL